MKLDCLMSRPRQLRNVFSLSLICIVLVPIVLQAQNTISTYAGGGAVGTTAATVDLPGPSGAIRDAAGNTYIAAPYSTYVFKLSGTTVSTFAGVGYENFSGDGNLANAAGLALPTALAMDSKGNIYTAEVQGKRVQRFRNMSGL